MMMCESDGSSRVLHLSSRTMNRSLRKDGERFLDLAKRGRAERACALLHALRLPVTQVACQFSRAFRRELGITPCVYRRRHTED